MASKTKIHEVELLVSFKLRAFKKNKQQWTMAVPYGECLQQVVGYDLDDLVENAMDIYEGLGQTSAFYENEKNKEKEKEIER